MTIPPQRGVLASRGASVVLLVVAACGGKNEPPVSPAEEPDPPYLVTLATAVDAGAVTPEPPTPTTASAAPAHGEQSARAVLEPFASPKADHAALTNALRPTTSDYDALFDPTVARQIESAQAAEWDGGGILVKPKDAKQTELHVRAATGAELKAGAGNASHLPGGYTKIAAHVADSVTFHAFEFVEPGKSSGTAYDGLVFVNGHWVIVPKPWRALDAAPRAKAKKKRKK